MKFLLFIGSIVISLASYAGSRDALEPQQAVVLGVFVLAICLWFLEVIPLYVTGLLCSALLVYFGKFKADAVFGSYFDPVIVLFFGGFVLAQGVQKYHLDQIFVRWMMNKVGSKPNTFLFALMAITALLSMWMSNSAAAAIMIPVALLTIEENKLKENKDPFAKSLILGVAYAASLGGMGMIVGSPPNAIAAKYLNSNQIQFGFLDWLTLAGPFTILALALAWFILTLILKPRCTNLTLHSRASTKLDRNQYLVIGTFFLTVLGWVTGDLIGVSATLVALLPVLVLFSLGLLRDEDLGKISWSTLLLFGGGISLGMAVSKVGLDTLFVDLVKDDLIALPKFWLFLGLTFFGILVTMVASNTASAAILIPLFLPLAEPLGIKPEPFAVLIALAASLDFMMPVGTPPNAIAYSTGFFRVKEMMRCGGLVNLGTGILLAVMFYFLA